MADQPTTGSTSTGGGNGFLYFAIGALIVAVGVLGWMFYSGNLGSSPSRSDVALERTADAVSGAAKDIGDAAKDAARNLPTPAPAQPTPTAPQTAPAPASPG